MCMEDIRIGRRSASRFSFVTVPLTGILLVPPNTQRIALQISAPLANRITLSDSQAPVLDNGLTIYAGQAVHQMNIADHGAAVTIGLYAVAAVAPQLIGVLETIYPLDEAPKGGT